MTHGARHESLRQRVVRAGSWSVALQAADRMFGFIRAVILARLLSPDDFGLFGIAMLAMAALDAFTRTGFKQALVQEQDDVTSQIDVAWSVHVLRGLILALVAVGIAPYVAHFFEAPASLPYLKVIGVCLLFQGFTNPGVIYFQKHLQFHKQFLFQISGTMADLLVAVSAAVLLQNAWAMLLGLLARDAIRMFVSYFAHPHRQRFTLDRESIATPFRYGKWVTLSGVLVFVGAKAPHMVIGKTLGVAALGVFQLATSISQMAVRDIVQSVNDVAFPAYAGLREEPQRLRNAYARITGFLAAIAIPSAVGLMALGREFTVIFLGDKWLPMFPALSILAFASLINALFLSGGPLFLGTGHPKVIFKVQIVRVAALAVFLVPLSLQWDIIGAAYAVLFSRLVTLFVYIPCLKRILAWSLRNFLRVLTVPTVAALVMLAVVNAVGAMTRDASTLPFMVASARFVGIVLLGMGAYAVIFLCGQKLFSNDLSLMTQAEHQR